MQQRKDYKMNIWSILGIDQTTDKKAIRHAYSEKSKECNPETEPEKFQQLYQAYHEALEFAKSNQNETWDFFGEESSEEKETTSPKFDNLEAVQEVKEPNRKVHTTTLFDNIDRKQEPEEALSEPAEEPQANLFDHAFYINSSPAVQTALTAFQEFFISEGKKDWKEFVTTQEFLKVQFEENFASQLAAFLRTQTLYPVEALPYDMVKELYFCYYPFMNEHDDDFFENGFTELSKVLHRNKDISKIEEQHGDPVSASEVEKYKVYYGLHKAIKERGKRQRITEWNYYIDKAAREYFVAGGKTSRRDKYLYKLLAYLIEEGPVFSDKIYNLLIDKMQLLQSENSSEKQMRKPLCDAIIAKGVDIPTVTQEIAQDIEERRKLLAVFKDLYNRDFTDADRTMLRKFFREGLYFKYHLHSYFMNYNLCVFANNHRLYSKIFLEEYLAFYDEVYEQTNTDVGKVVYTIFSTYLKENTGEDDAQEIRDDKYEWVKKHFFEEGFTRVWQSSSKGAMRVIYRGILEEQFAALAELRGYEWEMWDDGYISAVNDGDTYIFSYDKVNEKVTLSIKEYYQLLEEMLEVYMGKYFVVSSEKDKLNGLKEKAREVL